MNNTVIRFEHVSKRFTLHRERPRSFQDLALSILRRQHSTVEDFWALRDVSLTVNKGEVLGLIGPNGAGKSTILKLMTRILEPTSGTITVQGRVAALLELGTGFHPDLTGRENVFLNGSLLGFTRRQMQERLDSIIDFADMARFIDIPVRHYSSGMFMRLGFAIAVHSDPDILITDEVLAVGDEAFQNKCLERMSKFRDEGVTIVLVSHALPIVRKLCDRVIWLEQGSIVMDGETDTVVDAYTANVAARQHRLAEGPRPYICHTSMPAVIGLADIRLLGVELVAADGTQRWNMAAGERVTLRVHYQSRCTIPEAVIIVQIHDAEDQTLIYTFNSHDEKMPLTLNEGRDSIDLPDLPFPLRDGRYLLSVAIFRCPDPPAWANPDDLQHKAYTLRVHSPLIAPQRRWGSGRALIETVHICSADDQEKTEFATGETMRIRLRCISKDSAVENPVVRVQIFDQNGVLCHATNNRRTGTEIGLLNKPREVVLTYDHLDLLEGQYVLNVGLWPSEDARRPYDWHESAYRFVVHSERRHGSGLVALSHRWEISD